MADDVLTPGVQSPVNPTGESTRRPPRYRGNPWEILMGSADPQGADPQGLFANLKLGADRFGAATIQALQQSGRGIGDAWSAAHEFDDSAPTSIDVLSGAGDFIRNQPDNSFLGTARDMAAEGLSPLIGRPGFLNPDGEQEGEALPGDMEDPIDKSDADVESIFDKSNDLILLNQQVQEALESGALDEQGRVALEEARMNIADQLDQLALDLEEAKHKLNVQDVLFDFQADQLGFDHDLGPLEEALEREGGVGLETMQAIRDIANDTSLSLQEKTNAIDAVNARGQFSAAIVDGISEMVQNRDDLQKLSELEDTKLAGRLGVDTFFNPTFPNAILVDPDERWGANFSSVIDQTEQGDWLAAEAPDELKQMFLGLMQEARELGTANDASFDTRYQALAQASGYSYTKWRDLVGQGLTRAQESEKAAEQALEADSLPPYSEAMTMAIAGAGQELIEAGVNPEAINLIANYPGLHAIIETKSGGKAGKPGEGTIRGIGGLTEDMYRELMNEDWTPDKGMEWELQALLLYIIRQFNGDPMDAMSFFHRTGGWGGVSTMGGDMTDEQSSLGGS